MNFLYKIRILLLSLILLLTGSVFVSSASRADSLEVLGGVVTWPDKMYLPDGCSSFSFQYRNSTGVRLLQLGFIISDPFGRKVEEQSEVGIDPNKSGTWNAQMCAFDFKNGLGPYNIKVYVKDYSSTQREVQKEIYFLSIPNTTGSGSSGSGLSPAPTVTVTAKPAPAPTVTVTATPAPAPTVTVTATPAPAPTVTVTATPAPAPTVTVTATPAPAPTVYTVNPADQSLADMVKTLTNVVKSQTGQISTLNAKLKKICSAKPKPKGC